MYEQAVRAGAVMGRGAPDRDAARAVAASFAKMAELKDDLAPLLGDAAADYGEHAARMADSFSSVADGNAASGIIRQIRGTCRACHSMKTPAGRRACV